MTGGIREFESFAPKTVGIQTPPTTFEWYCIASEQELTASNWLLALAFCSLLNASNGAALPTVIPFAEQRRPEVSSSRACLPSPP